MSDAIIETTALLANTRLPIVSRVREGQRTYYPEDWHY